MENLEFGIQAGFLFSPDFFRDNKLVKSFPSVEKADMRADFKKKRGKKEEIKNPFTSKRNRKMSLPRRKAEKDPSLIVTSRPSYFVSCVSRRRNSFGVSVSVSPSVGNGIESKRPRFLQFRRLRTCRSVCTV